MTTLDVFCEVLGCMIVMGDAVIQHDDQEYDESFCIGRRKPINLLENFRYYLVDAASPRGGIITDQVLEIVFIVPTIRFWKPSYRIKRKLNSWVFLSLPTKTVDTTLEVYCVVVSIFCRPINVNQLSANVKSSAACKARDSSSKQNSAYNDGWLLQRDIDCSIKGIVSSISALSVEFSLQLLDETGTSCCVYAAFGRFNDHAFRAPFVF
eukprot:scaffold2220_cov75-Cylindrotheca_fusiformis.AAC.3